MGRNPLVGRKQIIKRALSVKYTLTTLSVFDFSLWSHILSLGTCFRYVVVQITTAIDIIANATNNLGTSAIDPRWKSYWVSKKKHKHNTTKKGQN